MALWLAVGCHDSVVPLGDAPAASPDGASDGAPDGGTPAYITYEKFNTMPTGEPPTSPWTSESGDSGSIRVREVPFAFDKSVEISKPTGEGTAGLSTTIPSMGGRIVFEAKVKARETAGFKAIPYVYDANGNAIASVSFQDGAIRTHIGSTTSVVQPFVANVWYLVRLLVDTDQGTLDLYVDGVRKQRAAALRTPAGSVAKLRYYLDGAGAGTLLVDNIRIYAEASYIGSAPSPVFDVRDFGAVGNGSANDQQAIQAAIEMAAGTGGSVLLTKGTYRTGTLTLRSHMTFFIDPSAVLLGSTSAADYPAQTPGTGNTQLSNCKRALLYAPNATEVTIDGGGTIDGQGDSFSGAEGSRPMLIWAVLSDHVNVRNLYLKKGAMWSLVSMESDHVRISNINLQSDNITHDGIDVVDGTDIIVENVAVRSGDDAMCLKTGVRRGIDTMVIRDSLFSGSNGGSNGIKFGTASYGAFKNITIEDAYVKDVQYAAMAVESRQGADVDNVAFHRIELANVGDAFFVYLAQQETTHPTGDVPKIGSITGVSFVDIAGATASWPNSPHQASLITGHVFKGTPYRIKNLEFRRVAIAFRGGRTTVPGSPPEAMPNQYPESNMFGDLPASAYFLRHVDGVTFDACDSQLTTPDARQKLVTEDVSNLVGAP